MKCNHLIISVTFLLIYSLNISFAQTQSELTTLFSQSLEEEERGNYQVAAVKLIEFADASEKPDYRVGHQLMRLVTEKELDELYEKSSEVYFWGLNDDEIDAETERLLLDEIEFLEPILGKREAAMLRDKVTSFDPEVFDELKSFWYDRSFTPSDQYNERLIEHWLRVSYAMNNYKTGRQNHFDDRGNIYIRFGEPTRKKSGILMHNPGFANYLISTRMDDGQGSGSAVDNAVYTTMFLNTLYQVREYHQYPSYEAWVYDNLTTNSNNTIYIFGNTHGGKTMSLMQSVDDFIPSAAFSMTDRNNPVTTSSLGNGDLSVNASGVGLGGEREDSDLSIESLGGNMSKSEIITPALVLQIMYYRQLADLDIFFSSRYEEMLDLFMNTTLRLSSSAAMQLQQTNTSKLLISQRDVPEDKSSFTDRIYDLGTHIHAYQFFHEDLSPYVKVYFTEETDDITVFEQLKKHNRVEDLNSMAYQMVRTVRVKEADGRYETEENSSEGLDNTGNESLKRNVVNIPVSAGIYVFSGYSELYDIDSSAGDIVASTGFRENLVGIGNSEKEIEVRPGSDDLFISDVIIGYHDTDDAGGSDFRPSHERVIPHNKSISFYYEAYHLKENESGLYSYSLTYNIKRDRSVFGRLVRFWKNESTSMTINNTNDSPVFTQMLEIVFDELQSGDYVLELSVSHHEDEAPVYTKEVEFTIR